MENEGQSIASLQTIVLPLPPSCLEFCPAHPDYFVIGTYNLEKKEETSTTGQDGQTEDAVVAEPSGPQSRNGSIIVCRLVGGKIDIIQTLSQVSAVLDIHFQQVPGRKDICAAASSTGTISIFRLQPDTSPSSPLHPLSVLDSFLDADVLITAFSWHPHVADVLAFTTSSGKVHLARLEPNGTTLSHWTDSSPILQHDHFEAWTVALFPSPKLSDDEHLFTVYSGGDDSMLRHASCSLSPYMAGAEGGTFEPSLPATRTKGHDAGVVAILPLGLVTVEHGEDIVVTGSYDDHIRVIAIKPGGPTTSRVLTEKNLGGGVWRLKLISSNYVWPSTDGAQPFAVVRILASCMHAGARVLELRGTNGLLDWDVAVLARFEEHKSMNYASDFWPRRDWFALGEEDKEEVDTLTCASTSFYDKLLCLWEVKLKSSRV